MAGAVLERFIFFPAAHDAIAAAKCSSEVSSGIGCSEEEEEEEGEEEVGIFRLANLGIGCSFAVTTAAIHSSINHL